MPLSPEQVDHLTRPVVDLYLTAEGRLLTWLARQTKTGINSPQGTGSAAGSLPTLRRQVDRLLTGLAESTRTRATTAIQRAYLLGAAGVVHGPVPARADDLVDTVVTAANATHQRARTWTLDVYQHVIHDATTPLLRGTRTRRQAAQDALDRLTQDGVTGYVDRAGRSWDRASYIEMTTRTATGHAALEGQVDRLRAQGIDLVLVSDAPQECAICRRWEGAVLSLTGAATGRVHTRHVRTGHATVADVAGSLAHARATGLFHPNCRHSLTAYLPGATIRPQHTADPDGDQARQRLRYLERQIRRWKRREAVALDQAAAARARQIVRDHQSRIHHHVSTTQVRRQRQRERMGAVR